MWIIWIGYKLFELAIKCFERIFSQTKSAYSHHWIASIDQQIKCRFSLYLVIIDESHAMKQIHIVFNLLPLMTRCWLTERTIEPNHTYVDIVNAHTRAHIQEIGNQTANQNYAFNTLFCYCFSSMNWAIWSICNARTRTLLFPERKTRNVYVSFILCAHIHTAES